MASPAFSMASTKRLQPPHQFQPPNVHPPSKPPNIILKDFFKASTFHGFPELANTHYGQCWRACWILLILVSTALAIYNVDTAFGDFFDTPTVQQYNQVTRPKLEMPDLLFCTHQRFDRRKMRAMGASSFLIEAMGIFLNMDRTPALQLLKRVHEQSHDFNDLGTQDRDFFRRAADEYQQLRLAHDNITIDRLLMRIGIDCEDVIEGCGGRVIGKSNGTDCCKLTKPILDYHYGMCHRLRLDATQNWPGPGAGLTVLVNSDLSMMGGDATSNLVSGILLDAMASSEIMSMEHVQIPGGVMANVHLDQRHTILKNVFGRQRTCIPNDEPISKNNTFEVLKRTTNGCFYGHWAEVHAEWCGCSPLTNMTGYPVCEPFDFQCEDPLDEVFWTKVRRGQEGCMPPCDSRRWEVTVSYARMVTDRLATMGSADGNAKWDLGSAEGSARGDRVARWANRGWENDGHNHGGYDRRWTTSTKQRRTSTTRRPRFTTRSRSTMARFRSTWATTRTEPRETSNSSMTSSWITSPVVPMIPETSQSSASSPIGSDIQSRESTTQSWAGFSNPTQDARNSRKTADTRIILDIFHPRMEVTVLNESELYTLGTLMSNLGGAIGLYLGASVLTFCQLFMYLLRWIATVIRRCGRVEVV